MNEEKEKNQLIPHGFQTPENPIAVSKLSVEYIQDCDGMDADPQSLEITTEDGGSGVYYVMKTERWSFGSVDEIVILLKDFEKRI